MAKVKRKKPESLILQHDLQAQLVVENRNLHRGPRANQYTEANQLEWAESALGRDVTLKLKDKITLSAARTLIKDRGWLNAISCQHVFPTNPTIEFNNDRTDHFGGKLEFWLENITGGKNYQFIIRMNGYNQGGATISVGCSQSTAYSLVPVNVTGGMNLTLGNVIQIPSKPSGGLVLLTLEVQFHNAQYGSWQFIDVVFTEAT
jgi:hypothetical protein